MIAPKKMRWKDLETNESLDVFLSPTGKTFVDGMSIALADLFQSRSGRATGTKVRIYAGESCRFDHLADVFRMCKEHGFQNVELVS